MSIKSAAKKLLRKTTYSAEEESNWQKHPEGYSPDEVREWNSNMKKVDQEVKRKEKEKLDLSDWTKKMQPTFDQQKRDVEEQKIKDAAKKKLKKEIITKRYYA